MMKPYLLVTGDFVKTGGMDRPNFALADYLARQGAQVHLVAYRVAAELLAQTNVTFHQVPKVANSYLLSDPLLNQAGRFQALRLSAAGGRVLVNGGNCLWGDANWVHYVHAAYKPDPQAGLVRQIKGLVSHQIFLATERRALQSARVIIVNSNITKRHLIEKLGISGPSYANSPQQIHTVYYGIDPQIFYPATPHDRTELRRQIGWSQEKPIVAFIGALGDRRKGFDTLFSAWQQLCATPEWDADLVVIGSGAELPQWQRRAIEAGISSRIHFLGFRSDVPNLLRSADCLVAPTRYEAYGLGVQEALCCGLPALVSATAGVAERYPPHLGDLLLPNPEDAADLAARLRQWRQAMPQYSNLVSFLSEELRTYTWDDMAASIIQKIEEKA
jgi:glycosyltransferase involved in cell wall biosynthesis